MTGSDLIVAAPWIAFAIGLAVLVVRLLRVRHGGRQPARRPGPRSPRRLRPGRGDAGTAAPTSGHRNHQLPLPQRTITCSRKKARHLRPR
jgi:hypothetical protein